MLLEITRYALEAWNDYDLRLDDCAPVVDRYEWSESQHPRFDAGAAGGVGGEFRPKGGSGGGNRPGGALPAHQMKAAMAKDDAGWISAMNEGRAASTQVNAPANRVASQVVDAWRKSGSGQQKPAASKSTKRELAALPTIDKDHALHHSKLPPAMQQKVLDWNYRMYQLVSPVDIYGGQSAPGMRDQAEEAGWATVDKNKVRAMLTEMNQMDVEARSAGVPLADFVNANGIIPRALAERLDGGARFFDPEKLRGKLGNGPIQRPAPREETPPPEPQKPLTAAEQKTATDFSQATRQRRGEMLANPSIKEAIERAMGLKPSTGGIAQPDGGYGPKPLPQDQSAAPEPTKPSKPEKPPKPVDHIKVLADANRGLRALGYKSSDAGSLLRKAIAGGQKFESAAELMEAAMGDTTQPKSKWAMKDGLTGIASGKVDEIVSELAGTNLDKQEHFKGAVLDSWKNLKAEADDHNDALRQITAHFGKSLGTLASNLSQGVDTAKIKGFDQLIDHAVREYPQLVSRLMGESSAGGPEDALADALREGIREVPQPWDDAVIDRAMSMVGPGFFEDTPPMEDVPAGSEEPLDWEGVPFSVRSDVRRWVQRYWIKSDSIESDILDRWAEVDRYSQISAWVDKYAQMMFDWDESKHPRAAKGSEHGGEFVKRDELAAKPKMEKAEAGGLRVRGTTQDVTKCDRCGRQDLKKTIVVEHTDADGNGTGQIEHFGSECIAKIMRKPKLKIEKEAAAADHEAEAIKRDNQRKLEWRPAATKSEANANYRKTNRHTLGSYFVEKDGKFVRVDGKDSDDVELFTDAGYTKASEPVTASMLTDSELQEAKQRYPEWLAKPATKPKRDIPEGYVEQPRAKAGGEVSEVDGKFYKGGSLMPVHGLFSGQEKPEPKPKKQDGEAAAVKADQDKGPRLVRERSKDEVEADRARMEEQRQWDELRDGPVNELFGWIGDRPNSKAFRDAPGHRLWAPMAEQLGKDGVEKLTEFMRSLAVDRVRINESEKDAASYDEHIAWGVDNYQHFHTKKHLKAVPNSRAGEVWLGEFIKDSTMADKLALNNKLKELLGLKDKYSHRDSETKVRLGCVMLEAPPSVNRKVVRVQDGIAVDAVTGDGKESWPHVTVFYGIVDTSIADVVAMVRGFSPIELSFGKLSTFNNDDESVLKLEVESSELRALNQKIKDAFPSRQTHKDYKPHLTIAYLKPEAAKDHIGKCSLTGGAALFTHAVVSIGGEKQRVNLKDGSVENFATKDKYSRRSFVPVLLERKTAIAS